MAARRAPPRRPKLDALEQVPLGTRAALRAFLKKHHLTSPGIWLVSFKKATGKPRLEYDEIVEELLAFGWVDSLVRSLDAERSMLLCTPRKPTSAWSKSNKERVARLIAAGRMAPRGLALVEAAKRSGTWEKLDGVEALEVPPDLAAQLDALPPARTWFDAFPRSVKRAILEWIVQAKRPETREKRVRETATQAARNLRANQWRQPGEAPPGRRRP